MLWITGARNHHHTLLQIPPENHLRHRFPMGCGNFLAHRIIQQSPGEAPSPQRIPSLHNNPPFLNVLHRFPQLKEINGLFAFLLHFADKTVVDFNLLGAGVAFVFYGFMDDNLLDQGIQQFGSQF